MKVQIDTKDGYEVVDLDAGFDGLTLRESVALQKAIGNESFDELTTAGTGRPDVIQALVWVKLKSAGYDVALEAFDFDLSEIVEGVDESGKPLGEQS